MEAVYARISRKTPQDIWSSISTKEAAKVVQPQGKISPAVLFAVHKHLMSRYTHYAVDTNHRETQRFSVRPASDVKVIEAVMQMIRANDPVLQAFVDKACQIVSFSRSLPRTPAKPVKAESSNLPSFSAADRTIIHFLRQSLRNHRGVQENPYTAFVATIIKRTGLYKDEEIEARTVFRFLQELGVFTPWDDLVTYSASSPDLIGSEKKDDFSTGSKVLDSKPSTTALPKKGSPTRMASTPVTPTQLYLQDPLHSIRHDFGILPVFAIDDYGAEEIDDGISVEEATDAPGCFWLHAHVADPSSLIPPEHFLAQQARSRVETSYLVQNTRPMIPKAISERFGLGSVAGVLETPQNVMTFSSKIDESGNIVDYKVRAGVVRNVHRLKYDDVDRALGETKSPLTYPIAQSSAPPHEPKPIPQSFVDALRSIAMVSNRLFQKRQALPVFSWGLPDLFVSVSEQDLPTNPQAPPHPTIYSGFPNINISVGIAAGSQRGARRHVAEAMIAAGRVAARFCTDRGVPALYRYSPAVIAPSEEIFSDVLAQRGSDGQVPIEVALKASLVSSAARYDTTPGVHWMLGIPASEGYIRVTSPLRRYLDLLSHWQIKAALLPSRDRNSRLFPFSAKDLREMGPLLKEQESQLARISRYNQRYWATREYGRWVGGTRDGKSEHPMDRMEAIVVGDGKDFSLDPSILTYGIALPKYGVVGEVRVARTSPLAVGSRITVKFEEAVLKATPVIRTTLIS